AEGLVVAVDRSGELIAVAAQRAAAAGIETLVRRDIVARFADDRAHGAETGQGETVAAAELAVGAAGEARRGESQLAPGDAGIGRHRGGGTRAGRRVEEIVGAVAAQ